VRWDAIYGARGYYVYSGTEEGSYSNQVDIGMQTEYHVYVPAGVYFGVIAAYDDDGLPGEMTAEIIVVVP
jgi:hypothetical protein